jgi:hypothetical protein
MASFSSYLGQIYEGFRPEYVLDELPQNLRGEAIAGLDVGYRDHTAWVNIIYDHDSDKFICVEDYLEAERTTKDHAQRFQLMMDHWRTSIVFIDAAAAQFSADLAYNYDIATTKAKKDVLPGIAYVQTLVQQGRLLVYKDCVHVLAMLDQYRWDTREGLTKEKPKHDKYSHMADALRYALYSYTI